MKKIVRSLFTLILAVLMLAGTFSCLPTVLHDFTVTAQAATNPAKVNNLKVSKTTASSVTLSWSKASGAQKYAVYTYNASSKKYTKVGTSSTNSFTVKSLKPYTVYYFAVRAYKTVNGKNVYGEISKKVKAQTRLSLDIAKLSITTGGKSGQLKLTWTKLSGVTGYVVYRSTSGKSGTYKKIATVKGSNTYTDKKLHSSKNYYYLVRAYKNADGKRTYGKYKSAYLSTRPTKMFLAERLMAASGVMFDYATGFDVDWTNRKNWITVNGTNYCRIRKFSSKAEMIQYLEKYCTREIYGKYLDWYIDKNGKLYTSTGDWGDVGPSGWTISVSNLKDRSCTVTYQAYYNYDQTFYSDPEVHKVIYKNGYWVFASGDLLKLTDMSAYYD